MIKRITNIYDHFLIIWKSESGAFAIFFAALVPVLLGFGAMAINSAQVLNTRVRLSAAADESALAIAAINNKNVTSADIAFNKEIAKNYSNYYARNQGEISNINVKYNSQNSTYYVTSIYDAKLLLSSPKLTGQDDEVITVGNDNISSGIAAKSYEKLSTDITFVLDFSSSVTCDSTINSCELWSSTGGKTRADVLKAAVNAMLTKFKSANGIQFAIVPFEHGVPFRPKDSIHTPGLDQKNELGGEQIGCSVPYTLTSPYKNIDFTFWANKNTGFDFNKSISYESKYDNRIFYNMDSYRYIYYKHVIGPALGLATDRSLVDAGLCVDNGYNSTIIQGKFRYSCDQSIFTTENKAKVRSQYNDVIQIMKYMYWNEASARKGDFSIANGATIDFDTTLANIFKPSNILEFYQPTAPNVLTQRPFTGMCQSGQAGDTALLSASDEFATDTLPLYKKASYAIKNAQTKTYLIPLTNNVADKLALMTHFNAMTPGGGTDEMSGLLRAAPIAAQGSGIYKKLIVISDGKNSLTAGLPASLPYNNITDTFLDKGVCQIIRSELDKITRQQHGENFDKSSEIHYVSLADTDMSKNLWLTKCVDNDDRFIHKADSISDLVDIVETIIVTSESGYFQSKK